MNLFVSLRYLCGIAVSLLPFESVRLPALRECEMEEAPRQPAHQTEAKARLHIPCLHANP